MNKMLFKEQCAQLIASKNRFGLVRLFTETLEKIDWVVQEKENLEDLLYLYKTASQAKIFFDAPKPHVSRFEMIKFLALEKPSIEDAINLIEILIYRHANFDPNLWDSWELKSKSASILLDLCFDAFQKFLLKDVKTVADYRSDSGIKYTFLYKFYAMLKEGDFPKYDKCFSFSPEVFLLKLANSFLRRGSEFSEIAEKISQSLKEPLQKKFREENNWQPTMFTPIPKGDERLYDGFYGCTM